MEQSGGLSISNFQEIIENYEGLFKELTNELNCLKSEQINLKLTTSNLLEENKRLSKSLQDILEPKENAVFSALNNDSEADMVQNLRHQINSLVAEKDYTTRLWQNSLSTIDFLEDELRIYQTGMQEFIPKKDFIQIQHSYEERISSLKNDLSKSEIKLDAYAKNISKQLGAKYEEIDKSLETQAGAFKIVKNLEEEILNLQKRLQEVTKIRGKLESVVKEKQAYIQGVQQQNADCREKVKEALQIVEAALNEKDAALFRENGVREDIRKLNETLSDIVRETEEKVRSEIALVKREYDYKHEIMQKELKLAQDEIKIKSLDVEKYSTKCSLIENEIDKLRKGNLNVDESNTSRLLILEKNLESTFQKLLVSEKQNIQLISERDTIKHDMEQMAGHYERVLKTKEIEKLNFQNKITQLQEYLDESNANLTRTTENLEMLNAKIVSMELDFRIQKETQVRLVTESYSSKLADANSIHSENIKKLETEIETKSEMNKRWMTETKIVIENLEKLISDLKSELHSMKKQNKKLKERVQECNGKIEQYKVFVQLISKDVNKISTMTVGTGGVT